MSALATPILNSTPAGAGAQKRFTVDEYHNLIRQGFFGEDDPVELLEGVILFKMPRDPEHDNTIEKAADGFGRRLPTGFRLRVQSAITTADSEPEPDLAVVTSALGQRVGRHPAPEELLLVVEVANTSLVRDREVKGPLYARAGIRLYWLINLMDRVVEVYEDPSGPSPQPKYRRSIVLRPGDQLTLEIPGLPPMQIPVSDLLP